MRLERQENYKTKLYSYTSCGNDHQWIDLMHEHSDCHTVIDARAKGPPSVADPGGDPREQRNPPFAQNVRIDF